MSWYEPQPKQKPKRLPRRRPIKTVPSGIGDQSIVGNWLFYYLKGGDHLHDFSPYKNHGTIKGASWKDGRYGWALSFDGVDDYVDIGDPSAMEFQDEITVSVWVKAETWDGTTQRPIVSKDGKFNLASWNGTVGFDIQDDAGNWHILDVTENPPTGEWVHLVGTYDGSTQKIFINGELDNSLSATYTIATSPNPLKITGYRDNYFNGTITIVRIYKVGKSNSWVSRRFERTKGIFS